MNTLPNHPEATPSKSRLILILTILGLCVLVIAGVLAWLYHPYFEEQRAVEVGEERRAVLNTLPENPRTMDLTFEDREQLLQNLGAPGE